MNVIEPSDMFEYISRHFKVYDFKDMNNVQECIWPDNFTFPLYESIGGLLDDKPVLCGGLTRKKRQISHCYIYQNNNWEVLVNLGSTAFSHRNLKEFGSQNWKKQKKKQVIDSRRSNATITCSSKLNCRMFKLIIEQIASLDKQRFGHAFHFFPLRSGSIKSSLGHGESIALLLKL